MASRPKRIYMIIVLIPAFIVIAGFIDILIFSLKYKEPRHQLTASTRTIRLEQAGTMPESSDDFWWLTSGGYAVFEDEYIKTNQEELPYNDPVRLLYSQTDPQETDDGYRPQNIFRLVSQQKYLNSAQSMYFKINYYDLSNNVNRAGSNGVLFMSRYSNKNNLYYTGLRVDGHAVIKKKINGIYYTMAYEPVYAVSIYDRDTNPNLLASKEWIGLKTEIKNLSPGTVSIKLFIDKDRTGNWELAAEAVDDGKSFGGSSLERPGSNGIRTDFMDVEFYGYKIE